MMLTIALALLLLLVVIAQVCRYYLAGNCAYGDQCRYQHSKPGWSGKGQPALPR